MKKILLFLLLQLIWICLLVGVLMLYHSSLNLRESYPTTITIMSGNPQNGKLILNPDANALVSVCRWRKVTWEIHASSTIESFRIEKKDASKQIFILGFHPPSKHTKRGSGTVDGLRGDDTEFNYTIFWKMPGDTVEKEFDPKLAVNSNSLAPMEWLIYIVYAILGLLSFGVFRTAKK